MKRSKTMLTGVLTVVTLGSGAVFAQNEPDPTGPRDNDRDNTRQDDGREGNHRPRRSDGDNSGDANDDQDRGRRQRSNESFREGAARDWNRALNAANDPETVEEALAFFKEHSPFRYGLFVAFADNATNDQDVAVARLRQKMVLGYIRIEMAAERYGAGSRDLAIQRLSDEDLITEKALALKGAEGDDAKSKARDELREAVRGLLLTGIAEREHRLEQLRERLEWEVDSVEKQRAGIDEEADKELERILEGGLPPVFGFDDGPGRRGPGAGGPGGDGAREGGDSEGRRKPLD